MAHTLRNLPPIYEEESTVASDTSSLGCTIQMPHAFLPNSTHSRQAQLLPTSCTSPSNSCVREEAKVYRLVIQAKRKQEASVKSLQPSEARMAQSMSMKLPAYHRQQASSAEGKETANVDRIKEPLKPIFRGKESAWLSAAAKNSSFSNASEPISREGERKRWRSWMPRFSSSSSRSTLIHV